MTSANLVIWLQIASQHSPQYQLLRLWWPRTVKYTDVNFQADSSRNLTVPFKFIVHRLSAVSQSSLDVYMTSRCFRGILLESWQHCQTSIRIKVPSNHNHPFELWVDGNKLCYIWNSVTTQPSHQLLHAYVTVIE